MFDGYLGANEFEVALHFACDCPGGMVRALREFPPRRFASKMGHPELWFTFCVGMRLAMVRALRENPPRRFASKMGHPELWFTFSVE
jgi:hypothetical protein